MRSSMQPLWMMCSVPPIHVEMPFFQRCSILPLKSRLIRSTSSFTKLRKALTRQPDRAWICSQDQVEKTRTRPQTPSAGLDRIARIHAGGKNRLVGRIHFVATASPSRSRLPTLCDVAIRSLDCRAPAISYSSDSRHRVPEYR